MNTKEKPKPSSQSLQEFIVRCGGTPTGLYEQDMRAARRLMNQRVDFRGLQERMK